MSCFLLLFIYSIVAVKKFSSEKMGLFPQEKSAVSVSCANYGLLDFTKTALDWKVTDFSVT